MAALGLSLLFAVRTMAPAFGPGNTIQDDARQFVVSMLRFHDPDLFAGDLIADYFRAIAPPGYSALYWVLSWVVDPLLASKLLPPLLGLAAALFVFLLVCRLHPTPAAPFLASVLLNWYLWQHGDLPSATPRAFIAPLLPALLWSLAAERLALAVGLVLLASSLYPSGGLLAVTLLGVRLVRFRGWRPTLIQQRAAWVAFAAAAGLGGALLLLGQLPSAPFGPTVSAAQAREMPEFGPNGRNSFFVEDAYCFWVESYRSGLGSLEKDALFPSVPIVLEYLTLGMLLPLLLPFRRRLPGVEQLSSRTVILLQLLVASFALFFLAHIVLFRLYLPNRYVQSSLPLVLAVAGGLALSILIEAGAAWASLRRRSLIVGGLALGLGIAVAAYPANYDGGFISDDHPAISAYLRAQPKDILIVGAPIDADSVPAFARRRVLMNHEQASAYHLGYYGQLRQRIEASIDAYYAESAGEVADFAARYGVDFFLVNRAAFRQETFVYAWTGYPDDSWEPFTTTIARRLERQRRFALLGLAHRCAAVDDGEVAVVPTSCLHQER